MSTPDGISELPADTAELKHARFSTTERKTSSVTLSLYDGDEKLIKWLQEYLGCSKSEAVRSAIRSFGMQLQQFDKRQKEPSETSGL